MIEKNNPCYFLNNCFIYPDGKREYFNGQKEYISMPERKNIKVNNANLWQCIKEVYIPVSQMCASVKGIQFYNKISKEDKICFYDIETDENDHFVLGFVNEKKFTDPLLMVKDMENYDIFVSFNGLRFDNEILNKYCQNYFYEIKNADFIAHVFKKGVSVDLFALIRVIIGLESYSAENIAKSIGFDEDIFNVKEDKEKKCQQDIRINKKIWEHYDIPSVFNTISSLINCDVALWQIIKPDRLRKWILINKYLRKGLLPLRKREIKSVKMSGEPVKLCKFGFYQDYIYYDIVGAYNTCAINFGDLGIYEENDNTFSELQKELADYSKNQKLKPFMKSIANPLIGSQYRKEEFWRNEEIFNKIVKNVADKIKEITNKREDVIFVNTDCLVVPADSPKIEIEGYEVKDKYIFSELFVYNVNKWIGKTKQGIKQKGFTKINARIPRIIEIAKEEIHLKLMKVKGSKFLDLLNKHQSLVSKTIRNLKKLDDKYFKIVIRKNSRECNNLEYSYLWDSLKMGWNELYYDSKGELTPNPKKKAIKYYKDIILDYAEAYSDKSEKVEVEDE